MSKALGSIPTNASPVLPHKPLLGTTAMENRGGLYITMAPLNKPVCANITPILQMREKNIGGGAGRETNKKLRELGSQ